MKPMNHEQTHSSGRLRADLEAAEWLIRRDRGLSAAEQDEFMHWLSVSPHHGEWLARHQATWKDFNLLAQWRPEHSVEPNPDLLARPRPALRWLVPAIVAVAASVAVGLFLWQPAVRSAAPAPGVMAQTYERRILEDGSVVELNRGALIETQFTPRQRRVWLRQGEAHFTVTKDAQRPFVVQADRVKVRAVGTAFNVKLGDESVEVLVTEGRVQVNPAWTLLSTAPSEESLLHAGQRAIVSRTRSEAAPLVDEVRPETMAHLLAWQPTMLNFDSAPLCDVALAFNRGNRIKLVIADNSIGVLPIVASFRSDNVEGFVRLLEATTEVRAERTGDIITLRRTLE
jgi:transmembrane sensor